MQTSAFSRMRADMVDKQVVARGVYSLPVLEAMRAVPREVFVPQPLREFAYEDVRIPVALGQQLPRPSMVGVMLAALELRGTERVLEIGTGSGYVTALLSHLAQGVHSIEPQGPAAAAAAAWPSGLPCCSRWPRASGQCAPRCWTLGARCSQTACCASWMKCAPRSLKEPPSKLCLLLELL